MKITLTPNRRLRKAYHRFCYRCPLLYWDGPHGGGHTGDPDLHRNAEDRVNYYRSQQWARLALSRGWIRTPLPPRNEAGFTIQPLPRALPYVVASAYRNSFGHSGCRYSVALKDTRSRIRHNLTCPR